MIINTNYLLGVKEENVCFTTVFTFLLFPKIIKQLTFLFFLTLFQELWNYHVKRTTVICNGDIDNGGYHHIARAPI